MKKTRQQAVAFFVSLGILIPQSFLFALNEADFNPNNLLSDEELQAWQVMSRDDIQAFLEEKGSYVAEYRTQDKEGMRRKASDIIARAAVEHRINPKYILVKLQKEQSLITETNPTDKQLDGATGYGIDETCGWTCETYLNNKGFGKQVDSAAAIMRWYYDNVNEKSWIKRPPLGYAIDDQYITPTNYATGFLYTYTPHIQGNKNFWKLWNNWFEAVYPDGSLLKTAADSTVYVLQDGKKRAFKNFTALTTRHDPKRIIQVAAGELTKYEAGADIALPNYSVVQDGSNYYLLDYDTARPFASKATVQELGYHPDEILAIASEDLAVYQVGKTIDASNQSPLGRVVRVKENGNLYYLKDNLYHPIYDEDIARINFPHLDIEKVSAQALLEKKSGDPILFNDGALFGAEGDAKIYAVEKGKKRHIANEDVFNGLGYDWKQIAWVNEFASIAHETGQPIYAKPKEDSFSTVTTPPEKQHIIGPAFETGVNSYLIAEYETGVIMAEKNIDTIRPIASLTKMMTAYELAKEGLNLQKSVTYDPAIHKSEYHYFRIVAGERILNKHLMDAMLVSSINTAARMLVQSLEKDERLFIARMNSRAKEWGLSQTLFIDPSGVSLENKGTAREYLTIFTKTIANDMVSSYAGKASYEYDELVDLDGKPRHFDSHTNELMEKTDLSFDILGSKTGYLEESGDHLAMLVKRKTDGKKFVIITMGNPDHVRKFDEPKAIAEWVMKEF